VIPILFNASTDPVQTGLVASLNRPGGNVTGVTYVGTDIEGKQLGLLHALLPGAARFAVLVNPAALIVAESTSRGCSWRLRPLVGKSEILSTRDSDGPCETSPKRGRR
jgi:hypothetical protein